MSIPNPAPIRSAVLETENPDDLARIQPERPRSLVQLENGVLRFRLRELVWGTAGIQIERWSCGVHMQLERPANYIAFSFLTQASARWMGVPIGPGSVLRVVGPWECVSNGPLEHVAFLVSRSALDAAASLARDPDQLELPRGHQIGRREDAIPIAIRLLRCLHGLESQKSHPSALAAAEEDLVQLALFLDRPLNLAPVERLSSSNGRLAAVRRVEAYLEANQDVAPSIPTLCQIAGVSERTLEYAFREQRGVTPMRYLKLRRLMQARRKLQNPEWATQSVTGIAAGCGIYELGRFSGEYRKLFCELPSETRARSLGSSGLSAHRRTSSFGDRSDVFGTGLPRGDDQFDRSNTRTPPHSASTMLPSAQPTP